MAYPKRPIQCYCEGEKLGEKTAGEWAEVIGSKKHLIGNAKNRGSGVRGADGRSYRFYDLGVTPPPPQPAVSVAGMDAICKAEQKSYGKLQTEIMAGRIVTPEDVEEAKKTLKHEKEDSMEVAEMAQATTVADTAIATVKLEPPKLKAMISLQEFAEMADDITLVVYCEDEWFLTAPCESSVFQRIDFSVDSFTVTTIDDTPCLKVWVK